MPNSLQEWLDYIASLHTSRIDLGLQRIGSIAAKNQLDQFNCPVISVAGTNGKGSCVKILESIYSAAGYRVGAYYSPHILRFNERIRLSECDVDDATLLDAFVRVETLREEQPLSFFEFTTLAALLIFQQAPLDVIILEVGLGGRLDAVNVVESDVAVVSSIGLDHMDWLGDSLEVIAREKAGIFRANKPAICGDPTPPSTLVNYAREIGSALYLRDEDFSFSVRGDSWSWQSQKTRYTNLPSLKLRYDNAATALMAIECLMPKLPVSPEQIKHGLDHAELSGRFEQISSPFKAIFDVAHNPDSASYLAEKLAAANIGGKKVAIVGMLKDKDIPGTVRPLIPQIDTFCVIQLDTERAADSEEIVQYLKTFGVKSCYNFAAVSDAVDFAKSLCTEQEDHIVVFGSFYTVADVQRVIEQEVEHAS